MDRTIYMKEYMKEYRRKNPTTISYYKKRENRYINPEIICKEINIKKFDKIRCQCGVILLKNNIYKHFKSKFHLTHFSCPKLFL